MHPLRIYIVTHKPCSIPSDGVFAPVHVGRAVSKYKDEMAWMQGDDTGDNISQKNPQYCEMTAHYWIWKNVHDTHPKVGLRKFDDPAILLGLKNDGFVI